MELRNIYNEILTEHNMHPNNKHEIEHPTIELRGVNPSCGDDITLKLQLKNDEALRLGELFMGMIKGEVKADEALEELDEAIALRDIAHMPARVKCAVLGWRTLGQMLDKEE